MYYNEGTDVSDEKLIHKKNKKTISICIKGKEYRYVANPGENIERIFRSLKGVMNHSEAGYRALNYLKKHDAVCYYGGFTHDY